MTSRLYWHIDVIANKACMDSPDLIINSSVRGENPVLEDLHRKQRNFYKTYLEANKAFAELSQKIVKMLRDSNSFDTDSDLFEEDPYADYVEWNRQKLWE